jgi:hypothetical protein
MPGDKPKFSDRGREKPSSQSQPRDFIKAQAQKRYETKRIEPDQKCAIMKGGMDQEESRRIKEN